MKKLLIRFGFSLMSTLLITSTFAGTYSVPGGGNSIIGQVQYTSTYSNDTTVNVAHRYNLGVNSIVNANPGLEGDSTISGGELTIPTAYILPSPHKGIVVNLPEMRMYFYPDSGSVMTFPIGIGKVGKTIPVTNTAVTRKVVNPTWHPTKNIREFNREKGIELPNEMPAGPDNPLGPYAIYMRVPVYLIHSTIFPESIGTRASFGCIRMNEDDIKEFFPLVKPGTPIAIIDMPNKIGWEGNKLYLQSYPPLIERSHLSHATLDGVVQMVENNTHGQLTFVDWQLIAYLMEQPDGIPHEIGFRMN